MHGASPRSLLEVVAVLLLVVEVEAARRRQLVPQRKLIKQLSMWRGLAHFREDFRGVSPPCFLTTTAMTTVKEWRMANKLEMGSVAGRIVKTQNFVEAIN
jgi:hypothetical protein